MTSPLDQKQVDRYQREGFLLLPQILNAEQRQSITQECMDCWIEEKGPYDPEGTWLHNALLTDIDRKSNEVQTFYRNGPLLDVAEQLIGPNIKGAATQLTFKMRGNSMPFGWHQDNGYGQLDPPNAMTTLTALDDATRRMGAFGSFPVPTFRDRSM